MISSAPDAPRFPKRATNRYWQGKRSPNARLEGPTVAAIRRAYAAGEGSLRTLADRFGTNHRTVGQIVHGKSYR